MPIRYPMAIQLFRALTVFKKFIQGPSYGGFKCLEKYWLRWTLIVNGTHMRRIRYKEYKVELFLGGY